MDFASLPPDVQAEIREKQRQRKLLKKGAKSVKSIDTASQQPSTTNDYPSSITEEEYFDAAGGLCRDPNLAPTEEHLELLLSVLARNDGHARRLGMCNYFQFTGTEEAIWDPTFNARLAHEGFFTITTSRRGVTEPLPELQPFYGVLTWPNFESSKHVKKALAQVRRGEKQFALFNNRDPCRTWQLLHAYHMQSTGTNWLTKRYFDMICAASDDSSINFKMHCIELYDADVSSSSKPLAGEIGFSIGRVYTSLSGWTEERTSDGLGFTQLVLLGRWLQQREYAFWSLGHCYSPKMDYKRQLGHRIYPRRDFLEFLQMYRGDFRVTDTQPNHKRLALGFRPFEEGCMCDSQLLLDPKNT